MKKLLAGLIVAAAFLNLLGTLAQASFPRFSSRDFHAGRVHSSHHARRGEKQRAAQGRAARQGQMNFLARLYVLPNSAVLLSGASREGKRSHLVK